VLQVVPENDLRKATFTGICMGIKRNGPMTRFRMRNTIKGTGPVERTFLLYSPFVKAIHIKRSLPVRRAKLTYLRNRKDAESTFI
jgi:large subunit ribosomal protein L19